MIVEREKNVRKRGREADKDRHRQKERNEEKSGINSNFYPVLDVT